MKATAEIIASMRSKMKNCFFTSSASSLSFTKKEGIKKPIPVPIIFTTDNIAKANDL
jgi:hypothetical protein